jgi:type IV secretory pathway VirB4 component
MLSKQTVKNILIIGRTGDGKTAFAQTLAKSFSKQEVSRFIPSAGIDSHTQEINPLYFLHLELGYLLNELN